MSQPRIEYTRTELTEAEKQKVQADVLAYLKAGEGIFSGLRATSAQSGTIAVCGWVRQRDYDFDYRKYPLNRPFAASYKRRGGRLGDVNSIYVANEKHEAPRLYSYCRRHGLAM
jgi:hypothetical protein